MRLRSEVVGGTHISGPCLHVAVDSNLSDVDSLPYIHVALSLILKNNIFIFLYNYYYILI